MPNPNTNWINALNGKQPDGEDVVPSDNPLAGDRQIPRLPDQKSSYVNVDRTTGAPNFVRAAVASAPTQDDERRTLERYYGAGRAVHGPTGYGEGWMVNTGQNRELLVNPPGMDTGDVIEFGRELAAGAGGVLGGGLGAAAASPTVAGIPIGVLAGGTAGALAFGEGWDFLMRKVFGTIDNRTPLQHGADVLTEGAIDMAVPPGINKLMPHMGNAVRGMLGSKAAPEVAEAAGRLGMPAEDMTAGMLGTPGIGQVESILEAVPFSGMEQVRDQAGDAIGDALARQAVPQAFGTPAAAGEFIQQRVADFVEAFSAKGRELYNVVDEMIPTMTLVEPANTKAFLAENSGRFQNDPEFREALGDRLLTKLDGIFANNEAGGKPDIAYGSLRDMRTEIGERLKSVWLLADANKGELKQLYAMLSRDIKENAAEMGDEVAEAAAAADEFWKEGRTFIDTRLEPIANKRRPEDVWSALQAGIRKGNTDPDAIKKIMSPDDLERLGMQHLLDAGQATPRYQGADGAFSASSFQTNMAKSVQRQDDRQLGLLEGRPQEVADDVGVLSEALTDSMATRNTSRTAQGVGALGAAGAVLEAVVSGDPGGISNALGVALGAMASSRAATSFLQSKRFKEFLAGKPFSNPSKWTDDARRLSVIMTAEGISEDVTAEIIDPILAEAG